MSALAAVEEHRPTWTEVPAPAGHRGRSRSVVVAAGLVIMAPPALWGIHGGRWTVSVGWSLVALLLAGWVAGERPRPSLLPEPGPGALPAVVVLTAVSAWSVQSGHSLLRSAVPFGLALVMPLVTRLGGGAVERVAARVGRGVGSAVSFVLFALLGVLTVVVPWAVQRVCRVDPLRPSTGWEQRLRRNAEAHQPWAPSATPRRTTGAERVRALLGGLVAAGAVVAIVLVSPWGPQTDLLDGRPSAARRPFSIQTPTVGNESDVPVRDRVPDGVAPTSYSPDVPQAAMAGATWLPDYAQAQGWAIQARNAWRPVNLHRFRDFRSDHLTIADGNRRTWAPPPGPRPRLRVWLLGGSTTYGLNQRDEHTIASELARVAHANGIDLDVVNKGSNGHLHWIEAERFAWDLTTEQRPDLVLFYDGVNETWEASTLNRLGTGNSTTMYDPTLLDAWVEAERDRGRTAPDPPPGGRFVGRPTAPVLHLLDEATVTLERYDRARTLSRATARANGIPVVYFWQPSRFSRPLVMSEPHKDTVNENRSRLSEQYKVDRLPPDVVSLVDAMRSTTKPLFTDDVHHNEEGARLVATAMFSKIRTQLELLSAAKQSKQSTGSTP